MPDDTTARINSHSWQQPAVFDWLQREGNIKASEMYRTFNCGIGMVLVVDPSDADKTLEILDAKGETAMVIGEIEPGEGTPSVKITA
jgi:phosphoribosylformylglycinamidine cyclo-ligase